MHGTRSVNLTIMTIERSVIASRNVALLSTDFFNHSPDRYAFDRDIQRIFLKMIRIARLSRFVLIHKKSPVGKPAMLHDSREFVPQKLEFVRVKSNPQTVIWQDLLQLQVLIMYL